MLSKLSLCAGQGPESSPLSFTPGAVTVFIGPNNSGKSLALRDIVSLGTRPNDKCSVVSSIELPRFSSGKEMLDLLRTIAYTDDGSTILSYNTGSGQANLQYDQMEAHYTNLDWVQQILGQAFFMRLDGRTRLTLMDQAPMGDLQEPGTNHLAVLFRNDSDRKKLREAVLDAFKLHLVLDATNTGKVRARMSKHAPDSDAEEQGLDQRARDFHKAAPLMDTFSDGVRAFSGLLAAVLASNARVLLVDEPEAFLHPTLARKLGHRLATLARDREANVIVATHSAEFLMGCIESGVPVQIVRLTYESNVATARLLPAKDLQTLMLDPLLRSAKVLSGLFHDGVCVGESDTDRAFYQEINYRLQSGDGARNTLFLNAQNKQTVRRIIEPLRRLGVPAAAIVDIDVIKDGGNEFTTLLTAAGVPQALHNGWANTRAVLNNAFKASSKDMKRDGGVALLSDEDALAATDFFERLQNYGVFVVRGGELESWLPTLAATGHGVGWLLEKFKAMKSDPADEKYLQPATGDVWDFMRDVAVWLSNPNRMGVN